MQMERDRTEFSGFPEKRPVANADFTAEMNLLVQG